MYGLIIGIHIIVCILLMGIVLIQSGRGGGLTGNFSSMESLFGTKTNSFLTRTTAVLATLFILTCLSLTLISTKRSKSLIEQAPPKTAEKENLPANMDAKHPAAENEVSGKVTEPDKTY